MNFIHKPKILLSTNIQKYLTHISTIADYKFKCHKHYNSGINKVCVYTEELVCLVHIAHTLHKNIEYSKYSLKIVPNIIHTRQQQSLLASMSNLSAWASPNQM